MWKGLSIMVSGILLTAILTPVFNKIWVNIKGKIVIDMPKIHICIGNCISDNTIELSKDEKCKSGWAYFKMDEEQELILKDKGIILCIKV